VYIWAQNYFSNCIAFSDYLDQAQIWGAQRPCQEGTEKQGNIKRPIGQPNEEPKNWESGIENTKPKNVDEQDGREIIRDEK